MINSEVLYTLEELPLGVKVYIAKLVGGNTLASSMYEKSDNSVNLLQHLLSITSDASKHQSLLNISKVLYHKVKDFFQNPENETDTNFLKVQVMNPVKKISSRVSSPIKAREVSEFKTLDELSATSCKNLASYMYILKNLAEAVNIHKLLLPLTVPDSLVVGFDFPHPVLIYTLKGVLTFQEISINDIDNTVNWLYNRPVDSNSDVPIFVGKIRRNFAESTLPKKLQSPMSTLEERLYWKEDRERIREDVGWIGANTNLYSIFLQRYILPKGMCASIIRSEWNKDNVNEKFYLISSKNRIDGETDFNPNKSVMHYIGPSRTATNNLKGSSFHIEDKYDLLQYGRQPFTPFINKDIQSKVSKQIDLKKSSTIKLEILQMFLNTIEYAYSYDIPTTFEEPPTKIIQFLNNLCRYELEEEGKTSEDEHEEIDITRSFSHNSSFHLHKKSSSMHELNNRHQFFKRQAKKKYYIVDTYNRCNVYTRKALDTYSNLKESFKIIKDTIYRYVFRPQYLELTDLVVDFVESRNGKCYLISIKSPTTIPISVNKLRKMKRSKNISIFQKGEVGGAERRKEIVCCGDYCKLIKKADNAIKEKLQLLMRFNIKASQSLLELMIIHDNYKNSFEDPTLGMFSRCETGLLKKNFQYKIMRKTILEDRTDPKSLPSVIKELPSEILKLLSEEEHKDREEIKHYMKQIESKKHKEYKSKGLAWEFEIVPVCAICYKFYNDRQNVQKQKRVEAKRASYVKLYDKKISRKNLQHLRRLLGLDSSQLSITPTRTIMEMDEIELDSTPKLDHRKPKKQFVSYSEADFFKNRFFRERSKNLSMIGRDLI